MKQVYLFIVGLSFCASIHAQSQIITGTNVPVIGKPLIFTPVLKEEPVITVPEKVMEIKPVKVTPAKLQWPYPSLERINVFTTLSSRPYYGITPLDVVDTFSLIPRVNSEKIKTNLHGQLFATGTLLPKKGQETILAPMVQADNTVADNGIELNGPPVISNPALTNPANYVPDNSTTVAVNNPGPGINVNGSLSSNLSNYSTPTPNIPVYSGTKTGGSTYSNPNYYISNYNVPGADNTNYNPVTQGSGPVLTPGQQTLSPIDFADTAAMAPDPMRSYGLPSSKLNLKAQDIKKGTFIAEKGSPKIFIPIPKDSIILEPSNAVIGKQNVAIDTTPEPTSAAVKKNDNIDKKTGTNSPVNKNSRESKKPGSYTFNPGTTLTDNNFTNETKNSNNSYESPVDVSAPAYLQNPSPVPVSTTYLRTTFYVSQEGKYSVAFTSTQFYVTISNEGKLADYGILSNGAVTNDYDRKVSMVGNVRVVRNYKGDLDSINDVRLSYTYDGKINKIGNLQILYNRDGLMQKVGDINVDYNFNNTVDKIANYRIGYKRKQVIGIDDSDGLVVYKPSIQK